MGPVHTQHPVEPGFFQASPGASAPRTEQLELMTDAALFLGKVCFFSAGSEPNEATPSSPTPSWGIWSHPIDPMSPSSTQSSVLRKSGSTEVLRSHGPLRRSRREDARRAARRLVAAKTISTVRRRATFDSPSILGRRQTWRTSQIHSCLRGALLL